MIIIILVELKYLLSDTVHFNLKVDIYCNFYHNLLIQFDFKKYSYYFN